MDTSPIGAAELGRALALPDLSDAASTPRPHAVALLLAELLAALRRAWPSDVVVHRGERIVGVDENYALLGYAADATTRDRRYTRYVDEGRMLRSHTSALVARALRDVAATGLEDVVVACPGLTWRRDAIDRLHSGEPHQLDLWRVAAGGLLGSAELRELIALVCAAALPGRRWRTLPAVHPYTTDGLEIEAEVDGRWVEIGECGLAAPHVLERAGLAGRSGLALGLGLDRLVMLRKGVDDIRLLRSTDPRVADQLGDLLPYRPVSAQPPTRRDLSLALAEVPDVETLGDRVRAALGSEAEAVEEVALLAVTPAGALPALARERIGLADGQVNALVRVVLRHPTRTLGAVEANRLRDRVYASLHEGSAHQWARPGAS